MTNQGEKRARGIQRYCLTSQRTFPLDVIAFDQLKRTEHVVRIVDLSVVGVGIESSERLEPGLVYFNEHVVGQKFGVLTWSKQSGNRYRAGIHFVVLPQEKEAYIREQVKQSRPHKTLRDPEKIIASLLDSMKDETHG